jgi:hypothetical protein
MYKFFVQLKDAEEQYEDFVRKGVIKTKSFGLVKVDGDYWSCGPQDNRSWLWTLHAFTPFDAIIQVGDSALLNVLIETWQARFESQSEEEDFPWHDHATALRLDRLSRMALELEGCRYTELAARHAKLLLSERFYSKHTNHGFDQALSLILAALAFGEHDHAAVWKKVGLARLKDEIEFAFTDEGVHVENSPAYHMGMISNMVRARSLLEASGVELGDFDVLFNQALEFLAWITRPDRYVAYLGDSASYRPSVPVALASLKSADLVRWVSSGGREGVPHRDNWKVYEKSGYAIYRSSWKPWENHTHIVMKCGFLSRYHRQDDDLTILLHALGEDWLIDSGLYNHNQKDPVRIFMRSALAHNIPYLQGVKISRSNPCSEFASLKKIEMKAGGFGVDGRTAMYEGGVVSRRLFVRDSLNLEFTDSFSGFGSKARFWLFHTPLEKEISIKGSEVEIAGKSGFLNISCDDSVMVKRAVGFKKPFPSVLSLKLNALEDTQVVVFGPSTRDEVRFSFSLRRKS